MVPDPKPHAAPPYWLGIVTAIITILLSYAYCYTGKDVAHTISIINIGVNVITLFIFRKHLLRFDAHGAIVSMDWYLCINIAIGLSALFGIFLHHSGNSEFKETLEIKVFFDFLVFCTFLVIGIQLGLRMKRIKERTGYLRVLGDMFIVLVPVLFFFVLFFTSVPSLRDNLPLHIMLTTLAQAPLVVIILIFYIARKDSIILTSLE